MKNKNEIYNRIIINLAINQRGFIEDYEGEEDRKERYRQHMNQILEKRGCYEDISHDEMEVVELEVGKLGYFNYRFMSYSLASVEYLSWILGLSEIGENIDFYDFFKFNQLDEEDYNVKKILEANLINEIEVQHKISELEVAFIENNTLDNEESCSLYWILHSLKWVLSNEHWDTELVSN